VTGFVSEKGDRQKDEGRQGQKISHPARLAQGWRGGKLKVKTPSERRC
jgi:hypothetical protein